MSEAESQNEGCPIPRMGLANRRVLRSSRNTSVHESQEELQQNLPPGPPVKPVECIIPTVKATSEASNADRENSVERECAVCLQSCVHPVRLPCSHIFCYLCVKGVAFQSKRCAMCRQEIPSDFLLNPQLLDRSQLEKDSPLDDGYQWFYEGRNGWWQYDDRTATSLEETYQIARNQPLEMLIAGATYVIDFERWVQFAKERPGRVRKIKRDRVSTIDSLGVAGIRRTLCTPPGVQTSQPDDIQI